MTDREREHCLAVAIEVGIHAAKSRVKFADILMRERAAVRAEARREALEEAARVADEPTETTYASTGRQIIVQRIRSLLSTDPRDTQGDGGRR